VLEHATKGRITWQYHRVESHDPMTVDDLDTLGRDGWELCGVLRSGGVLVHTFRRPSHGGPEIERR
jgi:hypothetical protein